MTLTSMKPALDARIVETDKKSLLEYGWIEQENFPGYYCVSCALGKFVVYCYVYDCRDANREFSSVLRARNNVNFNCKISNKTTNSFIQRDLFSLCEKIAFKKKPYISEKLFLCFLTQNDLELMLDYLLNNSADNFIKPANGFICKHCGCFYDLEQHDNTTSCNGCYNKFLDEAS